MKIHIVFDLDGTLTDTQTIHQKLESDFLKSKGIDIQPEGVGLQYAGRTPKEWIPEVLMSKKINFTQEEVNAFVDWKNEVLISLLHAGKIDLIPHAFETLIYLYNKGYKIGISSGSGKERIKELVKYFHLEEMILASTSSNEVEHKKPYPDVFLATFEKIEKIYGTPDTTYVIGDGWADVEGGHKAGAKTVWLNPGKIAKLDASYCDFEIGDLKELQNIL
ncbi:MAG: HAD family phosphatase [candidate division SR1 bacterium]|nr:HAD family phosphatase [candidate division SR1 bacterium]